MLNVRAQAPVPDFSASSTSGCGPLSVAFKDLSTNSPLYWTWDFGNGQTSAIQNPTITYGTAGTYTVTLIVRNRDGSNAIRKTDYITIFPYPTPNFKSNLTLACAPANIQFTDISTSGQGSIASWTWDLGDGTTSNSANPSHVYTQTGYYNISLKVTNSGGCSNTINSIRYLRVVDGVQPEFDWDQASTSCVAPFVLNFTNQSAGPGTLTYNWAFSNGGSSTDINPAGINYPSAGTYNVTLQASSSLGCNGTVTHTLPLTPSNAVITGPDTVCVNTPAAFTNGSTPVPATTTWDFGDGTGAGGPSASKTYITAGGYNLKLVNTYPTCKDSIIKVVQVVDASVPDFAADATVSCKAPFTVQFTDKTTGAAPHQWLWDFGDGSTSTDQNPSHTYGNTGVFDVKLTVVNAGGCSASKTGSAFIRVQAPTVSINSGSVQGCVSPALIGPAASISAPDGVAAYAWSAPDATPTSSTSATPGFSFPAQGSYPISLTITTTGGCTASANANVLAGTPTIPTTVTATASPSPVCGRDPVTFTSTDLPPNADHWNWDFGDGTFSPLDDQPIVSHSYQKITLPGIPYKAHLTVFHSGCPQGIDIPVTVLPPIPRFGDSVVCAASTPTSFVVDFHDSSQLDNTKDAIYSWDFGDGSPAETVTVLANLPVPYPIVSHTYGAPGPYTVTLSLTNGACANQIVSQKINLGSVTASFTGPATGCENTTLVFSSTSTSNPATPSLIAKYEWETGTDPDKFVKGLPNYGINIKTPGLNTIMLKVTDSNGCSSIAKQDLRVTGPLAKFALPPGISLAGGCQNSPLTFTDQSIPYSGSTAPPAAPPAPIATWTWDFGDGNGAQSSPGPGPGFPHSYTDTGSYTVSLTVTDNAGCPDTYTNTIPVLITAPVANFSVDDTLYCPNALLLFQDSSQGYSLTYNWNFGDGNSSTLATPGNSYANNGNYYSVSLTVTDATGCTGTLTKPRYIHIQQPIAAFDITDTTAICAPLQTFFTGKGLYYDSLYWDFGDGTTSTRDTTSHFYNEYGPLPGYNYVAKYYVKGAGGCLDSAARNVYLFNPFVDVGFGYGPPLQHCDSLTVSFQLSPPPFTKFTLLFQDGGEDSSGNHTPVHTYRTTGSFDPQLIMQDSTGCVVGIGSSIGAVTVLGATPFFSMNVHAFCDSSVVNFTDYTASNDGIASENWDFGDGTRYTGSNPSHDYTTTGVLLPTLKVVTDNNCTESYTDTLKIYQTPHPTISTTGSLCTGLIQFQGGLATPDADTITWAWNFGNGQTSASQNPAQTLAPGTYTVHLKASVSLGCNDTTSSSVTIFPLPVIKGPGEITTPVGVPVIIPFTYSENVITYNWTPQTNLDCPTCANPSATLTFAATYQVTATDANGCVSTDTILVKTTCNDQNYFFPNTFSPNGDGVNDYFYPRGVSLYNIQSLSVFNRWGQMVFQRKDFPVNVASMGWDGRFNGQPAASDAYLFIAAVICNNGQVVAIHGDITLIR